MRGAAYIDGFNFYHAVDDLQQPYLKWVNYRRLAELVSIGHAASMNEVIFATAYFNLEEQKHVRHERFVRAQECNAVSVPKGHMADNDLECPDCGWRWTKPCEKQSDINVALTMYRAAVRDEYDVAFLFTADSDQVATVKAIRRDAPDKRIYLVTPPGRSHSKRLRTVCHGKIQMTVDHLERAVMPASFPDANGLIVRPTEYDPPEGWFHPNDRPKGKPPKPPKNWSKGVSG